MNCLYQLLVMLFLFSSSVVNGQLRPVDLQNGDLLFRTKATSSLGGAIDAVTQTAGKTHFSHVGIVEWQKGSVSVLHASPEGGSCQVALSQFFTDDGQEHRVVVYRLKSAFRKYIPAALERAHSMLGKPYNFSYIMTDTAYYCSDFVYRCFEPDSVFQLQPMTFINPRTGKTDKEWAGYYHRLGIAVPEKEPGCNPNGMAASVHLQRVGELKGDSVAVSKALKF